MACMAVEVRLAKCPELLEIVLGPRLFNFNGGGTKVRVLLLLCLENMAGLKIRVDVKK